MSETYDLELLFAKVDKSVMIGDHMYSDRNPDHYFSVGRSAMTCITASLMLSKSPTPRRILDFACGSGRVTRWLRAAYPDAQIVCADIRQDSLQFLQEKFCVETFISSKNFDEIQFQKPFDLIWCGSLITHLPSNQTQMALQACSRWLSEKGVGIVTFCGEEVKRRMSRRDQKYLPENAVDKVIFDFENLGYGFASYPNQIGIGLSICKPEWVLCKMREIKSTVVLLGERAWDGHQDVIAFSSV